MHVPIDEQIDRQTCTHADTFRQKCLSAKQQLAKLSKLSKSKNKIIPILYHCCYKGDLDFIKLLCIMRDSHHSHTKFYKFLHKCKANIFILMNFDHKRNNFDNNFNFNSMSFTKVTPYGIGQQ